MAWLPNSIRLRASAPTTQSAGGTQEAEPSAAATQPAPDESPLGKLKRRAQKIGAMSSSSFSTSPVAWSRSNVGGLTPPDVRGPPRRVALPPVQTEASAGRPMPVVDSKVAASMAALSETSNLSEDQPQAPETTRAWVDADVCRANVIRMFGRGSEALAQRVFEAVPQQKDARYRYEPQLILATALHSVCPGGRQQVAALLDAAQMAPRRPPAPLRAQLAALHRVLAATGAGMEVLCHLEGVDKPRSKEIVWEGIDTPPSKEAVLEDVDIPLRKKAFCDAMRISIALADKGFDPGGPSLLDDLVRGVDTSAARAGWLCKSVGTDYDVPQQLLTQALLYAHGKLHPESVSLSYPHDKYYKYAYEAWNKGRFTESGPGTEFNKTIASLNKTSVYGERGDHGPRTAANLAREAGHIFPKMIGHYKSPISQMRHGAMGGDRTLLDFEAVKFTSALNNAIDPLLSYLETQANDPLVQQDLTRLSIVLARIATLEQWKNHGRKSVEVDLRDVLASADRRYQGLCLPGGARLDEQAMLKELGAPSKLRKYGAPGRSPDGPGMKLHLQVLKDWAAATLREGTVPAAVADELQLMPRRVKVARSVARGGDESNPLFVWRDAWNIITRKQARQGPSLEDARRVALRVARCPYESMTHFTDGGGGGLNVHAILGLKAGHGASVVPALRAEMARTATVTMGVSLTGGRFFVGTQNSKSLSVGLTGAFGVPLLPFGDSVAAGFAEASVSHDWSRGEGACIATRNDQTDWQQSGVDVVNFMFDHASKAPMTPRAFWESFVDRFSDDPNVALNWITEHTSATTGLLGVGGTVRGDVGHGSTLGPAVSADLVYTRERAGRNTNSDGADVPFEARSSRWNASVKASVVQATPKTGFSDGGVSGLLNTVPLVGASAELKWGAMGGVSRLARTADGLISPLLNQVERQFLNRELLYKFIEDHRPTLEAAMEGVQAESMTAEQLLPQNRLQKFEEQAEAIPTMGNHTCGAFLALKPDVAGRIDAAEARLHSLRGKGDAGAARRVLSQAERAECDLLAYEIYRLPLKDDSWEVISLYAFEANAKRSGVGMNLIVKAGSQGEAGANHMLALLVIHKPDLSLP